MINIKEKDSHTHPTVFMALIYQDTNMGKGAKNIL